MKIVSIKNINTSQKVVYLKPDSAILKKGLDFYIPEFSKNVSCTPVVVAKICKAGKYIQAETAQKYFEKMAFGFNFIAEDLCAEAKEKSLPWDVSHAFDGSLLVGDFISKNDLANELEFKIDNCSIKIDFQQNKIDFESVIASVSKYFTLKIGDFISVEFNDLSQKIEENNIFALELDDKEYLSLLIQ